MGGSGGGLFFFCLGFVFVYCVMFCFVVGLFLVLFFFGDFSVVCLFLCFYLVLFVSFVCVGCFLLYLCFLGVFFGLHLFCSLCLLEWSRCCSCFVILGLFCLCLFWVSVWLFLSVSHENHCFTSNSSVLGLMLIQSLLLGLVD